MFTVSKIKRETKKKGIIRYLIEKMRFVENILSAQLPRLSFQAALYMD